MSVGILHLDIVVPCYNEAECIKKFFDKTTEALDTTEFRSRWSIIFVDDGSTDDTLTEIKCLAEKYGNEAVKYISFSRNFGKEAAMYAGLSRSTGELVALMDADLQHPPALLPQMISYLGKGYDCCGAKRRTRTGEAKLRSILSKIFYRAVNRMTTIQLTQGGSDFRVMTRNVVDAILSLDESERFTKGIFSWVGFKTYWIEYDNVEREAGTSKWSLKSLANYSFSCFMSFSRDPFQVPLIVGGVISLISLVILTVSFVEVGLQGLNPFVQVRLFLSALFLLGGGICFLISLCGEYVLRIYQEVKKRPHYIAKETNIEQADHIQ